MPPTATRSKASIASIPFFCYGLLVAAWIVDLLTPQLFVAAILLNGPIALSSLTLQKRLTNTLVILAQIANVVAGYVNGAQAGHHWNGIAIGDRILLAASFVLVGYLSNKTQEFARDAGESEERARAIDAEIALRAAIGRVRASLNVELVLNGIVRESISLLGATRSILVVRDSSVDRPMLLHASHESDVVATERQSLASEVATLVTRARESNAVLRVVDDGAIARLTLASLGCTAALAVALPTIGSLDCVLLALLDPSHSFADAAPELLRAFSDQAAIAIDQARIFTQLGERNYEIAHQKDELSRRGDIIRDIVYALAHDLRTPLAAADVTMKQALTGAYGELPERYRAILQTTVAANEDQRRLLETLLLVARYEAGEESNVALPIDAKTLVARAVADAQPVADVQGVTLTIDATCDTLPMVGDPTEIRRAIGNLIANAIAATPREGTIVVRQQLDADQVSISVEDSGYGVPPERRAQLFERFGTTSAGAGTGLGLYIVRRIAEKHGGRVAYAPRTTQGSIFTITLPSHPE